MDYSAGIKREINEAVAQKLGVFKPYSTSLDAAWDIVEKYQVTLTHSLIIPADRESFWQWRVVIQIGPAFMEGSFVHAEADTAPLAIALCFLKLNA